MEMVRSRLEKDKEATKLLLKFKDALPLFMAHPLSKNIFTEDKIDRKVDFIRINTEVANLWK
jgi:hypothetical protein